MTALILLGILGQSAPPLLTVPPVFPPGVLTANDLPPSGATGEFTRQANGTVCFVVADDSGFRSEVCRAEFGDYPRPHNAAPPVEDPVGTSPPIVEDISDNFSKVNPGSQWGVVSLAAGAVAVNIQRSTPNPLGPSRSSPEAVGLGGMLGLGVRYGLRPRPLSRRIWMPALAFVFGTRIESDGVSPFLEMRGELLNVSPGGPLQPNFVVYGASGASTTKLTAFGSLSLQPHVGLGIGWNWFPRGSQGGGGGSAWNGYWGSFGSGGGAGLLVIPVALAAVAMIFAGRIEVRYSARPVSGVGSDFIEVMFGIGS